MRGRLRQAAEMYQQSWELADASARTRHEYPHIQHAALLLMEGEVKQAQSELEPQIDSLRTYGGDPWQLATALGGLGDVQKSAGDFEGARKSYQAAGSSLKKANSSAAGVQVSLAELSIAEGHPEVAESLVREAIADFEKDKSAGEELGVTRR